MSGGVWLQPSAGRLTRTNINTSVVGNTTVLASAQALWRLLLITADAVTVTLRDSSGPLSPPYQFFGPGGSLLLPFDTEPWFMISGSSLVLNLSAGVQVVGMAYTT